MLPLISHKQTIEPVYVNFLSELASRFSGDIDSRYSARLAQSTDNSVYQFIPQAVLYPKCCEDIQSAMSLAQQPEYKAVTFSPRGGGTGTNGQSLTHGLILDLSRYMTKVLEVNVEQAWVRVEAGVIKDALNDVLRPYGFFFSPDLSTSNRATIGGMINTDASGAGSLVYGKTSDHILGLTSVLTDGSLLQTSSIVAEKLPPSDNHSANELQQAIISKVAQLCRDKRALIKSQFPELNRFLTGYDLKHVWNDELTQFDLSRILAGSEGTLAVLTEAKLNITPLPKKRVMLNIKYDSFESALRHAPELVKAKATVVETIDSKVLGLAKEDIIWHSVSQLITEVEGQTIDGLNMLEFAGDNEDVESRLEKVTQLLDQQILANQAGVIGYQITHDEASINKIYAMRKKAVGLLGATKGKRKPLAFAEDTAVPPENLAEYILEFRALLDSKKLHYGMFGHVDAGVLHVRPALDMCDPNDEKLLRTLSDEVAALTLKYGGLMWGEHGKGVRGEYAPAVFGDELYGILREIKTLFDPDNRLNPGKLVAPQDHELCYDVDSTKRGTFDRQIKINVRNDFPDVMNCNGNGLCFNYNQFSPMCPSFKVTGDRVQSPKGRASLMREWLRLLEQQGVDLEQLAKQKSVNIFHRIKNTFSATKAQDYSVEVMESLQGCLACKACSSQCPVKVDVPKFRAQFFELYYRRYLRPAKDYLVGGIEQSLPIMARAPKLVNQVSQNALSKWVIKKFIGYVDAPALSVPTLKQQLQNHACLGYDLNDLHSIPEVERPNYVLVVQDPFNSFYDAELIFNFIKLIEKLGITPVLLPFKPNGKPAHIKGFLQQFSRTAKSSADFFNKLAKLDIPMVGIDPALVLVYRDEYKQVLGDELGNFKIELANEWLLSRLNKLPKYGLTDKTYTWFSHCTESTAKPNTGAEWQQIFSHFGVNLTRVNLGCCGMAGTYGHELVNLANSRRLFAMSWEQRIKDLPQDEILVSGYSCRSQVKRFAHFRPKHPIEALLTLIENHDD